MAKLTGKAQKELDDAVDSLGGGTIRPAVPSARPKKALVRRPKKTSRTREIRKTTTSKKGAAAKKAGPLKGSPLQGGRSIRSQPTTGRSKPNAR
jgi:hypothetical protein